MVIALSIASGLFTAAWGAYKDAPYERFSHASFWRSVVFSLGIAAMLAVLVPDALGHLRAVQVFFLVMGIERLAIEIYKPCFRTEDQSKYLIPQDGTFLGFRISHPAQLRVLGLAMICGTLGVLTLARPIASLGEHLVVAGATGFVICCFGAGKDAPYEGFQPRKFLRSALVLLAIAPAIRALGPAPLGLVIFIDGGVERLLVESYKTYFTPHRPGKFRRDLPVIDHAFLAYRGLLRALAISIVVLVGALYMRAVIS